MVYHRYGTNVTLIENGHSSVQMELFLTKKYSPVCGGSILTATLLKAFITLTTIYMKKEKEEEKAKEAN
jgi:hypothetical protein